MIPDKVKALFQFIEYLHSNIENFNKHNDLIKELEQLDKERNQLKPRNNYKDKQQYDKVQAELESKFKTLQDNTANLIKAKAKELNVCSFDNEPIYNFNGVETEIRQLKDNFSNEDLPKIFKHKSKYLEYRTKTHKSFWALEMFFVGLDRLLKEFFDYFKETEQNEFEAFEIKAIQVNDIGEAVKLFQSGKFQKFTLPNNFLNPSTTQQQPNIEALPPQQSTKYDLGENTEPNNLTTSTIEDWLFEFKERNILTDPNYTTLVNALTHYFENGTFPKVNQTIKVGRVNKKLLGWHLNRIFHSEGKGVEIDLLRFAKANISTFKDVEFDEKDIQNSNLYKYFTTKTK